MFLQSVIFVFCVALATCLHDLDTAAITVYKNPDFFRTISDEFNDHLRFFTRDSEHHFGPRDHYESPVNEEYYDPYSENYNNRQESSDDEPQHQENEEETNYAEEDDFPANHNDKYRNDYDDDDNKHFEEQEENDENEHIEEESEYKYPGEPKKPNPPGTRINVHFDGSPDFSHPPRDVHFTPSPRKKGRGPYGHPKHTADDEEVANYHQEYEDSRKKSEQQLLEEVAEENRKNAEGEDHARKYRYPPYHVEEPVHQEQYFSQSNGPVEEAEEEEIIETKKGTREYLKHHKLPPHHELSDFDNKHEKSKVKKLVKVGNSVTIRPKKTYIAYKIRPKYVHFKVVPYKIHSVKPVYYAKAFKRKYTPKPVDDDSAYLVNSELDQDFQKLQKIRVLNG